MKKKDVCLIAVLYLLLTHFSADAQTANMQAKELADKVTSYSELYPTERMYLDLDKSRYISGDTIWFKNYTTAGFYNQPSPLSGVAYVKLVNRNDSILSQAKVRIDSGSGSGFIHVPRELQTDNYQLIAYTKWILDVDSTEIFQRNIAVVNLFEEVQATENVIVNGLKIAFYPEGGQLVSGEENRVAFKLSGTLPSTDKVILYSEAGDSLMTLENQHQGMGSFQLQAKQGQRYYAKTSTGSEKFYLPDASSDQLGLFLLNAENLSDIRFKIYRGVASKHKKVIILMHINGLVTYAADANFTSDGTVIGRIPKSVLGPGVNYLTIFSSDGLPILERSVFIDKDVTFALKAKSDKDTYQNREMVKAEITSMLNQAGVKANLSMSVVSASQSWDEYSEDNIISYLLLSSRLKGDIQNPWYYFNSKSEKRYQHADLLMMVNGWSRYNFEQYLTDFPEQIHPKATIEQGLSLGGYLFNESGKKPIKNGSVNYIIQDSSSAFGNAITNDDGYFYIPGLNITGKTPIVLKGKKEKGTDNVKFKIDSASFKEIIYKTYDSDLVSKGLSIDQGELANSLKLQETLKGLSLQNNFELLEEVSVSSFKVDDQQKVNNLFGKGDYTLKAEDLVISQTAQHPLELVRGRVPGVRVMGSINSWSIMIQGIGSINSGTQPLILVDNLEVNLDFLNGIPASQIQQIEVYKGASAAIFGVRGGNGVLAFFTKNGVPDYVDYDLESVEMVILEGYQEHKEFYSVEHDGAETNSVPDYRTVLSWNPSLVTDAKGKYSTSFYTSDMDGKYVLVVEGMTMGGSLGFYMMDFTVK